MFVRPILAAALLFVCCTPCVATDSVSVPTCSKRIGKMSRLGRWAAAGLAVSVGSYAGIETVSTDPVEHFYDCPDCLPDTVRKHYALIGDSLSTDFFYSNDLPTLYRLRTVRSGGWFTDRSAGDPLCFAERAAGGFPLRADCHARAGASVLSSPDASFGKKLGAIAHLPQQVDAILSTDLPDHLWVWIGHNDADFVYACSKHPEVTPEDYCAKLPAQMRDTLERQLRRIADKARDSNRTMTTTVFGLLNFSAAIDARRSILEEHRQDATHYPYLPQGIDGFPTLMPEHEKLAASLSHAIDTAYQELVKDLEKEYSATGQHFRYSAAFSNFAFRQGDFSDQDGLHLSASGSERLAEAAWNEATPK